MNPSHYPDIERCKKLTELGFPMTEKSWGEYKTGKLVVGSVIEFEYANVKQLLIGDTFPKKDVVCPSVMEMLDVVKGIRLPSSGDRWHPFLRMQVDYVSIVENGVFRGEYAEDVTVSFEETLPNALADLIVWLVENGHLTFDKR